MGKQTLLLTLNIFSATGGIEKVCRVLGKALFERSYEQQEGISIWSMHDKAGDAAGNPYFPTEYYRAFAGEKIRFVQSAVQRGKQTDTVILSHINLLPIGWMIKKVAPNTRLILFAHGIEIWELTGAKKAMLSAVDMFWAVSSYTKSRIRQNHGLSARKIAVLNNCLDPFLPLQKNVEELPTLEERYGILAGDKILFSLNRLSAQERYKGYDKVIAAIKKMANPRIKYVIGGKADPVEAKRVRQLIRENGLEANVILAGYISTTELYPHFKMADLYIMPSNGEGFGVVFLEAMYYGLPVIAGDEDGSIDALLNGELGLLVPPDSVASIITAIENISASRESYLPSLSLLEEHFSYQRYKRNIDMMLSFHPLQDRLTSQMKSTEHTL